MRKCLVTETKTLLKLSNVQAISSIFFGGGKWHLCTYHKLMQSLEFSRIKRGFFFWCFQNEWIQEYMYTSVYRKFMNKASVPKGCLLCYVMNLYGIRRCQLGFQELQALPSHLHCKQSSMQYMKTQFYQQMLKSPWKQTQHQQKLQTWCMSSLVNTVHMIKICLQ